MVLTYSEEVPEDDTPLHGSLPFWYLLTHGIIRYERELSNNHRVMDELKSKVPNRRKTAGRILAHGTVYIISDRTLSLA